MADSFWGRAAGWLISTVEGSHIQTTYTGPQRENDDAPAFRPNSVCQERDISNAFGWAYLDDAQEGPFSVIDSKIQYKADNGRLWCWDKSIWRSGITMMI